MRALVFVCAVAFVACGEREEGVSVRISARVRALATAPGVDVHDALVAVTEVALVPCTGEPEHSGHSHGAGLEQGPAPVVVWLSGESVQQLGTVLPEAGHYCAIDLVLGPATVEAAGPREDVVGASFQLSGEREARGPFALRTASTRRVRVPSHVHLDAEHRTAALELELGAFTVPSDLDAAGMPEQLFDGVAASVRAP